RREERAPLLGRLGKGRGGREGGACPTLHRADPQELDPEEERALDRGLLFRPPRKSKPRIAVVEGGLHLAEEAPDVLEVEALARPPLARRGEIAPRRVDVVVGQPHRVADARREGRGGVEVAALLGLPHEVAYTRGESAQLAQVEAREEAEVARGEE